MFIGQMKLNLYMSRDIKQSNIESSAPNKISHLRLRKPSFGYPDLGIYIYWYVIFQKIRRCPKCSRKCAFQEAIGSILETVAVAMALLVRVGQATRSAEKLLELQTAMAAKESSSARAGLSFPWNLMSEFRMTSILMVLAPHV
jgi:hypothetical protein